MEKDRIIVSKDRKIVKIYPWECANIEATFKRTQSGFRDSGKRRIDAQVHDPSECWLSKKVYNRIKQKAFAILYPIPKDLTLKLPF